MVKLFYSIVNQRIKWKPFLPSHFMLEDTNFLEKNWEFVAPDLGGDVVTCVSGSVWNGSKSSADF